MIMVLKAIGLLALSILLLPFAYVDDLVRRKFRKRRPVRMIDNARFLRTEDAARHAGCGHHRHFGFTGDN